MSSQPSRLSPALLGNLGVGAALAIAAFALLALQAAPLRWDDPSPARLVAAALVVGAYLLVCGAFAAAARRRRSAAQPAAANGGAAAPILIAYASQTGTAEELARRSVEALRAAGVPAHCAALGALDADALGGCAQALFVVSTTGEGDAPDAALAFVRGAMRETASLAHLRYGLLALGDRDYGDFCGFGRRFDAWLRHAGATPLFDPVEVDNGDAGAIRHWQHHLTLIAGAPDLPDWSAPRYGRWRLASRRHLNPGSAGGATFEVALQPLDAGGLDWQAGDIAEVGVRNAPQDVAAWLHAAGLDGATRVRFADEEMTLGDVLARSALPAPDAAPTHDAQALADALQPLPHREYSIASMPADGSLQLLIRQLRRPDGRLGLGAGWLTEYAGAQSEIALRIRANPGFRAPDDARPLILIGNGTGLAGLRALLKARIAAGHRRNWLVFGERSAVHDWYWREEIERWHADGALDRLDLAFSRDQAARVYVQQRLREAALPLRAWVADDAAIHVCGSLRGMAPAVDAALREALGADTLERLSAEGRYRRDVY